MLGNNLEHVGFCALIGPPNAGKSTFLNRILCNKVSIVTPKAQTTRNKIKGVLTTHNAQIIFTDTPGITPSDFGKLLNNWMNRYSFSAADDADIVLLFVDLTRQHPEQGIGEEELHIIKKLNKNQRVFLIANKIDLVKKMRADDTIAVFNKAFSFEKNFIISAETGEGVEEMITELSAIFPSGPQYFPNDYISDQADEFLTAEIIREKIFTLLRQELPYSTVVTVESIRNHKTKDILLIDATIHVARKTQKGMIIGNQGRTLSKIGSLARKELEELFDKQIGLKLFVRIEEKWYEKEKLLKKVGFDKDFEE